MCHFNILILLLISLFIIIEFRNGRNEVTWVAVVVGDAWSLNKAVSTCTDGPPVKLDLSQLIQLLSCIKIASLLTDRRSRSYWSQNYCVFVQYLSSKIFSLFVSIRPSHLNSNQLSVKHTYGLSWNWPWAWVSEPDWGLS